MESLLQVEVFFPLNLIYELVIDRAITNADEAFHSSIGAIHDVVDSLLLSLYLIYLNIVNTDSEILNIIFHYTTAVVATATIIDHQQGRVFTNFMIGKHCHYTAKIHHGYKQSLHPTVIIIIATITSSITT